MSNPNSRRSFIWKLGAGAGAGVSAVVAAAAGSARPASGADDAAQRAAMLEEELVLRKFHQRFEEAMDKGLHDEVISMFADDAQVVFNGGVFSGRAGVTRLYRDRFAAGKSGGRLEPAPGFELAADQQRDLVDVCPDCMTATAEFGYSIRVGEPFETESSLAAMARLHGEGVRAWWEGGVYRIAYGKDAAGNWKISRLEYDTLSRADWRAGKSYAQPLEVARLSARFPQDPQGPDALV
jgi:carotenoid cleavage dioxygenase